MEKKTNNKKQKYYQIKVSIKNTHPPVWRRLLIPEGITFHQLNAIIQIAFDWCGYHMYNFEIGSTLYGGGISIEIPYEDNNLDYYEVKSSKSTKIDKYFREYKKMKYIYDFGDDWEHEITIEKEIEGKIVYPVCVKAKMASLPEDCGGPWGYEELLGILADKNHEQYEEMREWVENGYFDWHDDREYVDVEYINKRLEDYKEHAKFLLEGF